MKSVKNKSGRPAKVQDFHPVKYTDVIAGIARGVTLEQALAAHGITGILRTYSRKESEKINQI